MACRRTGRRIHAWRTHLPGYVRALRETDGLRKPTGKSGSRAPTCPHGRILSARATRSENRESEKPLILDHKGRLYLYRYWEYEKILSDEIKARAAHVRTEKEYDNGRARSVLDRLFPKSTGGETDWQRVAAAATLIKRFCILSGGPGTGKTTTVARILALLIEADPNNVNRIALSAPTGKAAVRLQDAIKKNKNRSGMFRRNKNPHPRRGVNHSPSSAACSVVTLFLLYNGKSAAYRPSYCG